MFEEVPRRRFGLARLLGRRVVLGPFVIGGGVLLATIGGSVALAATVITASSMAVNDLPPKATDHPVLPEVGSRGAARVTGSTTPDRHTAASPTWSVPNLPWNGPVQLTSRAAAAPTRSPGPATRPATAAPPPRSSSPTPTPAPSASPSGPAGNAVIHLSGYDQTSGQLQFEFATAEHGAGAGGSDLYSISSPRQFSAAIAPGISITSAGSICPPTGSSCTVGQLIAEAGSGFFAEAAIDADGQLRSVIEVDNAPISFEGPWQPPSPTAATSSPAMTAPSASPAPRVTS